MYCNYITNDINIICPICNNLNIKSIVYEEDISSTSINHKSYYDENGNYHNNDRNGYIISFRCSNNHIFMQKRCGNNIEWILSPEKQDMI